jgi:hypothetical protein
MKDREHYADRFSNEVNRILEQQGPSEEEGPPPEYNEMLALAEQLAALDFSQGSPLQPRLRWRLLSRQEELVSVKQRPRWWRRPSLPRPRPALGALTTLVALVMLVGWTPAGRAVTHAVGQFIRELHWPHTTLQQIPKGNRPQVTTDAREHRETPTPPRQTCLFSFEGRDFECGDSEDEPVRDEIVPLSQAIAEAGFDLQVPTFLPDGFVLSEVRLLGVAPYGVFVIYEGQGGRLGFYQSSVGVISEERPSENVVIVEQREIAVLTDRAIEDVTVGTTQAALIDGESLVWEENAISFRLIGPGLGAEMLVRIAESLAPAR